MMMKALEHISFYKQYRILYNLHRCIFCAFIEKRVSHVKIEKISFQLATSRRKKNELKLNVYTMVMKARIYSKSKQIKYQGKLYIKFSEKIY